MMCLSSLTCWFTQLTGGCSQRSAEMTVLGQSGSSTLWYCSTGLRVFLHFLFLLNTFGAVMIPFSVSFFFFLHTPCFVSHPFRVLGKQTQNLTK